MDLEEARQFLRQNHRTVLATRRENGEPQMSPVLLGVDGEGRGIISSRRSLAKVKNIERDPRIWACVTTDRFFGSWILVTGRASILPLPEAMEPLVDYYRRLAGEHEKWDEYRARMEHEGRVLIRVDLESATRGA
jgi:PPOX class probable F420-dependent enzyme